MFDKLTDIKNREGTTVFVNKGKIILLIDTTFGDETMLAGNDAIELLLSFGISVSDLIEYDIIADNNGISVYFLEV